jgi:Domain of unknown function (DUF4189)
MRMNGVLARGLWAAALGAILLAGVSGADAAGALAVGSCAAYGYAYDFPEEQGARSAALKKCSGRCTIVATMRRGCAAYAIDGHKKCGAHGYASAPTLGRAQNIALRFCYKYGGRDCMVRAWACDGRG